MSEYLVSKRDRKDPNSIVETLAEIGIAISGNLTMGGSCALIDINEGLAEYLAINCPGLVFEPNLVGYVAKSITC